MSDFENFKSSPILRHPTTWLFGACIAIHSAVETYHIREGHRANGSPLQMGWLWLDRTVDILFGGIIPVFILLCVVWMVAGMTDQLNAWVRQVLVVALYFGMRLAFGYLQ